MAYFNYLYVLVAFSFIISSGIHIFSRGFLLTRSAQTEKRFCDKFYITVDGSQCLSDDKKTCNGENIRDFVTKNVNATADRLCFDRKSKVVIVLIDALKYEFGIYDENLTNPFPYQNKLPIISELMNKYPDKTRLLKFLADPPTTTLQRLKGMTTGSLPTFIDMGSNFATPEINEDNVIDQAYTNNKTIVFMGDSTWTELFPKRFRRKFSYPSFNIFDLDTVDKEILKHLPGELKKPDWDLLIAHFLGVDHCGHRYGPMHNEMSRKLTETNEVIKTLSETIDDDTMLIVMGDHGMTIGGDHGGDSKDETEALLFAFSKHRSFVPTSYDDNVNFIQQIDLPSTLSTILGIPIPYSNLGAVSFQLLPDVSLQGVQRHQLALAHLWQNTKQIQNYFNKYTEGNSKTFSYDDLDAFETKFIVFEHRVNSIYTEEAFINFANDTKRHLDNLLELCRNIWIKFNPQLMTQGLLLTFLGIFVASILVYNVPLRDFPKVFRTNVIVFSIGTSIISAALGYLLFRELGWDDATLCALFMSSTWNCVIFGFLICQNWEAIAGEMGSTKKLVNIVPRISFAFSVLVFFSNSFIVQEQKILSYLLTAQVVYCIYELRSSTSILDFKGKTRLGVIWKSSFAKIVATAIGIFILLKMSHSYFKCREEQGDCWQIVQNTKESSKMDLVPVVVLAIFVTIARILLKASGNLTGFSLHVLVTKFAPILSVIAACAHLVLSQSGAKNSAIPQAHLDKLAWVSYGVLATELIVTFVSPLLIHVVPRNSSNVSISNYDNMIPELFRHVKNIFNRGSHSAGQIPIIYGLATVYSSVFVAFAAVLGIVMALLLGVKVSNGLIITATIGAGILFMFSVLRYESTNIGKECLQPKFSLIVTWFLLVNFGFYATSHQPTISQIDWNAAFVGRAGHSQHSNVVSVVLVLLSTFSSNFLLLSVYPLLILFPFMIYAIFPQLSMKIFMVDKRSKDENTKEYRKITLNQNEESSIDLDRTDFDVTRGEINLFENEKLFMSSSFKVGCQLLILQGVKVMASMIACTILCRHLMVWKIFAPRFIYEGIASYVSFAAIIFGFALLTRIHISVQALVDKINKTS